VYQKFCIHPIINTQPEGLDAEADAEADRIISEITGEALSSAGAAPVAAVPGKQHAAPAAAEEEPAVCYIPARVALNACFDRE
jgi:hypothetical protein